MRESGLACPADAPLHPARRVRAVEHGQDVLTGALHAERHAREPRLPQTREARVDGLGVRLGRHLGTRREPEVGADRLQDPAEVLRRQQRRRAPATNTVSTGRSRSPSTRRASRTSAMAVSAYARGTRP